MSDHQVLRRRTGRLSAVNRRMVISVCALQINRLQDRIRPGAGWSRLNGLRHARSARETSQGTSYQQRVADVFSAPFVRCYWNGPRKIGAQLDNLALECPLSPPLHLCYGALG